MVEFDGYAADCRLWGLIELAEGRFSDWLNQSVELQIRDAHIEDLADGHVVVMPELTVAHEELCAVVASGPRGDAARRLTTRTIRVEVEIGPYRVEGWVHGPRAGDPFASVLRRATWVPLTDAIVMYRRGEEDVREKVTTLLVNRHLMLLFREFDPNPPMAPLEARPENPREKSGT
jgi:hypothetical protein